MADTLDKKKALAKFLGIEEGIWEDINDDMEDEMKFTPDQRDDEYLQQLYDAEIDSTIEADRNDELFTYGKQEYFVLTDDEADNKFKEYEENIIDDIGYEGFSKNFRDEIMRDCVDNKKYFKDLESDVESWIEDSPDSYESFFDIDAMKDEITNSVKKDKQDFIDFVNDKAGIDGEEDEFTNEDTLEAVDDLSDEDVFECITNNGDIGDFVPLAAEKYLEQFDTAYDFLKDLYGEGGTEITKALDGYIDQDEVIDLIKSYDGRGVALASYDGNENKEGDYFIYRTN
jgi:hypothetical protein